MGIVLKKCPREWFGGGDWLLHFGYLIMLKIGEGPLKVPSGQIGSK
jgi:hypothetical protein